MIKRDLITGGNNKNVKDHISYQVLILLRENNAMTKFKTILLSMAIFKL